jgi:hypothetical protein
MLLNFKFFALAYLNDWWQYDGRFVGGLRPHQGSRRQCLVDAATYYQVIRSFTVKGDAYQRLDNALNKLDGVIIAVLANVNNIITPANVDTTVTTLATSLGSIYKKNGKPQKLVSAASKFLWICRRNPVVIFDDRAKTCLTAMNAMPGTNYKSYWNAWQLEFPKYETRIQAACLALTSTKNFAPNSPAKMRLNSIVQRRWFRERVFDKFLWWNGK